MIDERKIAFDNISKALAVTRYDIEQRQLIGDYGLNIHAENFFRDIFNFVYPLNLENANFGSQNMASIDLVDKSSKVAYQITTTRTKDKIENTLKALNKPEYRNYKINIFYLLEKANPKDASLDELNKKYSINLTDSLKDYSDLIRGINNLDTTRLIELNKKYFLNIEKYTDVVTLDLVFKHILQHKKKQTKTNYNNDDFGSLDANEKLKLNNINERISSEIKKGLDWASTLKKLEEDGTITSLKDFVIDDLYMGILHEFLKIKIHKEDLKNKKLLELHELAVKYQLNFNNIISELYSILEIHIDIGDFNSTSISWIIIAYFFEICDIGVKK